jgi:adenosylcobinamide amidohydrolase
VTPVTLERPWLSLNLGQEIQVLSWAVNRPGFTTARRILWREVRNRDLPPGMDVAAWLDGELERRNARDAVCFLTSRDVSRYTRVEASAGAVSARCVATVGLSNAERVGHRVARAGRDWGTVNIAVAVSHGLTRTGLVEALSIAAEARTAAIIDAGLRLANGVATGTGTDCIAVAAPEGPCAYAGLHTEAGEALGAAVYRATQAGALGWMAEQETKIQEEKADA